MSAPPLLEMRAVSKRFGAVLALDRVDFAARPGEVHALLGENGAGKSTLMQVASGSYSCDAGEIRLRGAAVSWRNPEQARAAGIAMVHQHFMLVPTLSVAENLALARGLVGWFEPGRLGAETARLAAVHRIDVGDPARLVGDLSVGERQRLEILKALAGRPRGGGPAGVAAAGEERPGLLVLDEPTAVLTPDEVAGLFGLLRELAAAGTAIVIVTHKLAEVVAIADRVTVLRSGRVIATGPAREHDERTLAALMVGAGRDRPAPPPGEVAPAAGPPPTGGCGAPIALRGVSVSDPRGVAALSGASLEVDAGEIVVVAGVEGNGQAELLAAVCGHAGETAGALSGEVRIAGRTVRSAADAREAGLAVVPADRGRDGLVGDLALWENLLLGRRPLAAATSRGVIDRAGALAEARARIAAFAVQPPDPMRPAGALSGGNQQRLVLAREIGGGRPVAVVAANPSRGLDLSATAAVRDRLRALARAGAAVLVLSSDLDEVAELAGRVLVLYRGRLLQVPPGALDRAAVGRLMAGTGVAA